MSDLNTAVMPFNEGRVGLLQRPGGTSAVGELTGKAGTARVEKFSRCELQRQDRNRTAWSRLSELSLTWELGVCHSLLPALLPQLSSGWNTVSVLRHMERKGKHGAVAVCGLAFVTLA